MTRERRRAAQAEGPTLTVVYWRDIPAQVVASADGASAKRELSARFQEAIDLSAMVSGGDASDAYLADWRRGPPVPCGSDIETEAAQTAERLEGEYDADRLAQLIANGGRERTAADTPDTEQT